MRSILLSLLVVVSACAFGDPTNLVVNGGFEQNGGPGSAQFDGWTVFNTGSGNWYAQTGNFAMPLGMSCSHESVDAPPSGFAAMTNMNEKGALLLYQNVAIPQTASKVTLTFDLFLLTHSGFLTQPSLSLNVTPDQQFRADVMDPDSAPDDTGSGVLMNLYQTKTGDDRYEQYKKITADLTQFAGRTIRLRFAVVDTVDCLNAGLDNVTITADVCPSAAPSQLAIDAQCPLGCRADEPVAFSAMSSAYVFASCDAYAWEFGDGATSSEAAPVHRFTAPGTYAVEVTVTNALGSSSASTSVTVVPAEPRRRTSRH